MPSVCIYLQVHQPFRLRKYSIFDSAPNYFDDGHNRAVIERVAAKCYLPVLRILREQIVRLGGRFRCALSVTGTALEQFEQHAPEVVQAIHALAQTGGTEFLGETYHHSLAGLYCPTEFTEQVTLHREMLRRVLGVVPRTFRNTELIYSNGIAAQVANLGFETQLAEGWEAVLNKRSAAFVYESVGDSRHPNATSPAAAKGPANLPLNLLLRNYRMSDLIAFKFSDPRAPEFPVTVEKFAEQVGQIGGHLCNVFMDMETFGEHQAAETGILDFLAAMPEKLLEANCDFVTPTEAVAEYQSAGVLDVPMAMSWADESRDVSAWVGNAMQANAVQELYKLEPNVKRKAAAGDPKVLADWRKLTTSDHSYYMSTKRWSDGAVHGYFSPYESPYDAYINFMNVLENLRARVAR